MFLVWKTGQKPILTLVDGTTVKLDVVNNVPMLPKTVRSTPAVACPGKHNPSGAESGRACGQPAPMQEYSNTLNVEVAGENREPMNVEQQTRIEMRNPRLSPSGAGGRKCSLRSTLL